MTEMIEVEDAVDLFGHWAEPEPVQSGPRRRPTIEHGPSERDEAPRTKDIPGSIIQHNIIDNGVRIIVNRGTKDKVRAGSAGYVVGNGVRFVVKSVTDDECVADLEGISADEISRHLRVRLTVLE